MHPSPFAEDDKQWPGEDVTSTSQRQIFDEKFDQGPESVRIKMADLAGRWNQKEAKKTTPHPDPKKKKRRWYDEEEQEKCSDLCHLPRKVRF